MNNQDMPTRLLDSAEHRMRRGGYNAVSFRDLAADTKIKSASVHYHFSRKEDLGVALIERYSRNFFEALEEAAAETKSSRGRLQAFSGIYRQAITDSEAVCLCGLLGAEAAGLPEPVNHEVRAFFEANNRWIADSLSNSISDEEKFVRANAVVSAHQGAIILASSLDDVTLFDSATAFVIDAALAQKRVTKK